MTFDSPRSSSGNLSWRNVKKGLHDEEEDDFEYEGDENVEVEYESDEYEEEEIVEEEIVDDESEYEEEEEIILEEEVTETEVSDIGDIVEPGVEDECARRKMLISWSGGSGRNSSRALKTEQIDQASEEAEEETREPIARDTEREKVCYSNGEVPRCSSKKPIRWPGSSQKRLNSLLLALNKSLYRNQYTENVGRL